MLAWAGASALGPACMQVNEHAMVIPHACARACHACRVDQSVEGAKQGLEAAAAANGLTLKLYYKKFLVISTEPLPEYR